MLFIYEKESYFQISTASSTLGDLYKQVYIFTWDAFWEKVGESSSNQLQFLCKAEESSRQPFFRTDLLGSVVQYKFKTFSFSPAKLSAKMPSEKSAIHC